MPYLCDAVHLCCRTVMLQGNVTVELYWKHAPITCRNFAELVSYENNIDDKSEGLSI